MEEVGRVLGIALRLLRGPSGHSSSIEIGVVWGVARYKNPHASCALSVRTPLFQILDLPLPTNEIMGFVSESLHIQKPRGPAAPLVPLLPMYRSESEGVHPFHYDKA